MQHIRRSFRLSDLRLFVADFPLLISLECRSITASDQCTSRRPLGRNSRATCCDCPPAPMKHPAKRNHGQAEGRGRWARVDVAFLEERELPSQKKIRSNECYVGGKQLPKDRQRVAFCGELLAGAVRQTKVFRSTTVDASSQRSILAFTPDPVRLRTESASTSSKRRQRGWPWCKIMHHESFWNSSDRNLCRTDCHGRD